jgi:serine/threonine-protein kinase
MSLSGRPEEDRESNSILGEESKQEENSPTPVVSSTESLPEVAETPAISPEEIRTRAKRAEKQRVSMRNRIAITGLAVSLLTAGGVTAFALSSTKPEVPHASEFVSASSDDSKICESFVKSSLDCAVVWTPSATEKRGTLLSESADAGTRVDKGTKITLTYSSGPATSTMPNLKNKTIAEAEAAFYDMNVTVSEIKEAPGGEIPKGNIISSSVAADTKVENGSTVVLNVSNGQVGVPNWTDKTKEFVETDAKKLGLTVNFIYEESEKASDLVLSQTPAAGEVSSSDKVDVVLSKSFTSKDIKVPDVIGKSAISAQAELAAAGFRHIKTVSVTNNEVTSTQVTQVVPGVGQIGKSEENLVIIVSNPSK